MGGALPPCLSETPKPVDPDTRGSAAKSQRTFRAHLSIARMGEAEHSSLSEHASDGKEKHLPNFLILTQPLSITEEKRP